MSSLAIMSAAFLWASGSLLGAYFFGGFISLATLISFSIFLILFLPTITYIILFSHAINEERMKQIHSSLDDMVV